MRGRIASIAGAATLFVLLIILFVSAPSAWISGDSPKPVRGHVLYTGRPDPLPWNPPKAKEASGSAPADHLVVKARLEDEDTTWLRQYEPRWQHDLIAIKSMYPHAHPEAHRPDKGRIADAYLRWIIENYNNLPETLVFLPPADTYNRGSIDMSDILNHLQIPFIQKSGFANLRCPTQKSRTTCNDKVLDPFKPPHELRTLEAKIPKVWEDLFGKGLNIPSKIATVLGAEFVVSRAKVQKRSVGDYLKYWTWLNRTIMDDDSSGLLFEYFWHIVFGKDAIFCPEPSKCECDLYDRCDGVL
ncbi:hypothetical protein IQ06DRAFT_257830 [Phaeosphaeriaceae sp. SRC1lsM3a]|nr:hypothetical protein IQ06DRAFT_257830 [Stagonospora sp. SRC1lsM3a]